MLHLSALFARGPVAGAALLALGIFLASSAAAQSTPKPTWATVAALASNPGATLIDAQGLAVDASGNMLVAGTFNGTLTLGATTLTSAGGDDIVLAKYVPATGTWAWAVRAGGTGTDFASGVAVRGTTIYLSGTFTNNRTNANGVTFGPLAQYGATSSSSLDAVLAKYTDNGTSATAVWTQAVGGVSVDAGLAVAVSSVDNSVYLTGIIANNQANDAGVVAGASGLLAGTAAQAGAVPNNVTSDLFLAKYFDNGPNSSLGWTQVAGGRNDDYAGGVAVSGTSVYLLGSIDNNRANAQGALWGGSGLTPGTVAQYGASSQTSQDLVLAKYTDNGTSATLGWTQVAGGTGPDEGVAVAASGSSVYVTGTTTNNRLDDAGVRFGGSGATAGTVAQAGASPQLSNDLVLAKYTDNGTSATLGWTQVAGGTGADEAAGLAVLGNRVYVAGLLTNNTGNSLDVTFGGSGLAVGTATQAGLAAQAGADVLAAAYIDNGATATLAWTQVAGGARDDQALTVAAAGTHLYVGGLVTPAAAFGSLSLGAPAGTFTPFAASLDLTATLGTAPAAAAAPLGLFPNPASGPALLRGATPGTPGQVLDELGRAVATFGTDAAGAAALPAGLAPGLYLVRVGVATARWVVR